MQPDVFVGTIGGERLLIKSFAPRPAVVRCLYGRWILKREHDQMSVLGDVRGVPEIHGWIGRDSLVMEYFEGAATLPECRKRPDIDCPDEEFFRELNSILDGMHRKGVSHGDIRQRNILKRKNGEPGLIDFATAIAREGSLRFFRDRLFRICRDADRCGVLKIRKSFLPDSLTEDEERILANRPAILRLGSFLRKRVYRPFIKQRTWRKRVAAVKDRFVSS